MYDPGPGPLVVGGGALAVGTMAATGFNAMLIGVVALLLLVIGVFLVRRARVRVDPDGVDPRATAMSVARVALDGPKHRVRRRRFHLRQRMFTVVRWTVGLPMAGLGLWVLANTTRYREMEAWSAAKVVHSTVTEAVLRPGSAVFFVGLGTPRAVGLRIDQLCSTAAFTGLVLLLTGVLLIAARLRVRSAVAALAAMVGLLVVVNITRLVLLSWSATRWGLSGWFEWVHLYGGSAVSLLAITVGMALYLKLIRRTRVLA